MGSGAYVITYTVIDSAGNSSVASDPMTVYVDFTAPNALGEPILESASDFGESNSDKITNDDRVNVILTDILPAYSGVIYSVNGTDTTKLDSGFFAPGDENLSFSVNTFTTGTYNYTSVHVDTAGNRSGYSNTLTVIVDHDDPTAVITFDGDSLVRAGDVSTLATFTFSEPMDSVNVPKVDVTYPELLTHLIYRIKH